MDFENSFIERLGLLSQFAGLANPRGQSDIFRPSEVVASECFDKEGLIRAHVLFSRRLYDQRQGHFLTPAAYSTIVEPRLPSAALNSLQRISITELKESRHPAAGRILFGELCVDATLLVSINTIIADINSPGKAARLHIYNVVSPNEKLSRAQRMYPKGMLLAVKEPYFKRCKDGALAIRVNNPADLVEISPRDLLHSDSDSDGPAPCSSKLGSARGLRESGNELFKMQDWKAAGEKYSNAISATLLALSSCSRNKGGTSSDNHRCSPNCVELLKSELVMAYSNRSEVRIRLNHFERAVADASKALKIQPTHLKSTFRKGVALLSLHSYNEALIFLQKALQMDPNNRDLKAAVQQGRDCIKQSSSGQGYNLSLLFEQEAKNDGKIVLNPVPRPACAEFIGPVEIRLISDAGKYGDKLERGIFTTKNVKCGELLLVSIAVALCTNPDSSFIILENEGMITPLEAEDLISKLVERARNSSRVRQQLSSLASKKAVGNGDLVMPEMALFIPNSISATECLDQEEKLITLDTVDKDVDVARIRATAQTNAFNSTASSGRGLWCLPSFINHSCIPNASCVIVGNAMFVRAARDLSAGEEVTISYLDVFRPVKIRQKQSIKGWGFECRCKRCMWEEDMMSSKQHYAHSLECLAQKYEELKLQNSREQVEVLAARSFMALANISAQVEQVLQQYCEVINTSIVHVNIEEWKGWLHSSFAYSYWCAFRMMSLGVKIGNEMQYPSIEEVVASIRLTVPGSESMLLDLGVDPDLNVAQGSRGLQQEFMQMGVALYGCRFSPSALATLLAIRKKAKMI